VDQSNSPVILQLEVHEDGTLSVWQLEGRTADQVSALLRHIADQFESGKVQRIG